MHPWQYEHVLDDYPWLRRPAYAPPGADVIAHLALVDEPARHVKTAVNVQMTSAVRTVSPAAVPQWTDFPPVSGLAARTAHAVDPGRGGRPPIGRSATVPQPRRVHRDVPPLRRARMRVALAGWSPHPAPTAGRSSSEVVGTATR